MTDRKNIGQQVRLTLVGNLHYSGLIIDEDYFFIIIRDKFNKKVSFSKSQIISMEVME